MLPQIRQTVSYALRRAPRHVREEEAAECVANAYCAFVRLVKRGRGDLAFPTVLAQFAIKQMRDGRRVGNRFNCRELMCGYEQRRHAIEILPLAQRTASGTWEDLVVEDRRSTPADVAALRLDFRAWLRDLDRRKRAVALCLAGGDGTNATARRFHLTPARISQLREELRQSWDEFQGEQLIRGAA